MAQRQVILRRPFTSSRPAAGHKPVAGLGMLCVLLMFVSGLRAAEFRVEPGIDTLAAAISSASPGDVLRLQAGVYRGAVTVDRPLTLSGTVDSVIDAGGSGKVITINAPDVVIRGVSVRGSGTRLDIEDSGIFVSPEGNRVLIEANRLQDNLIGIYLKGPQDAVVRDNIIIGSRDPHMNERGNGVHLWNTPGTVVEGNTLQYGRDGLFVMASQYNVFKNNRFSDMRYAIHYMYTHDSEVSDNISVRNDSAYALMFSERLKVSGNYSIGDRERGIFLNAANQSDIHDNVVRGGVEKCVFIYNANMNRFSDNYFEGCDIGIHFTAGSEQNRISGNTFIGNRTQVKYVGTRHIEWSADGRGNYWSDHPAFDLDGDGIADRPYRPNDMVDKLLWKHPLAKLLINTPAMQVLRWSQSEFPALFPGGVTDSAPLMQVPVVARTDNGPDKSQEY
jgi:nitrous oxidase accessory protein